MFPNSRKLVDSKESKQKDEEFERGLITSITHGVMSGTAVYLVCSGVGVAGAKHDLLSLIVVTSFLFRGQRMITSTALRGALRHPRGSRIL